MLCLDNYNMETVKEIFKKKTVLKLVNTPNISIKISLTLKQFFPFKYHLARLSNLIWFILFMTPLTNVIYRCTVYDRNCK